MTSDVRRLEATRFRSPVAAAAGILLALGCVRVRAESAPVETVRIFDPDDSAPVAASGFRLERVVDLRRIGRDNPRLVGSTTSGPFERRSWLWAEENVDAAVEKQLRLWLREGGGAAVPVRVEIASLETWRVSTTSPAAAKAFVRLRVLVGESDWRGATVEQTSILDGSAGTEAQGAQLRRCLRSALEKFARIDWRSAPPVPDVGKYGAEPDPWTDALKSSEASPRAMSRTVVHAQLTVGQAGYGTGGRAIFYHESGGERNPEFWLGARLRDPDVDGCSSWVGEVAGGKGYQHRLGGSPIVMAEQYGIILGIEKFTRDDGSRDYWKYVGLEFRTGGRWQPEGFGGISGEAGIHTALRVPSSLQWFDFGFYLDIGRRF